MPAGLDPAEAVCVVVNHLTAYSALHPTAAVRSGERTMVHGAAGGVGTALVDLGRLAELQMYGTASRHNHELVSKLGATPIDYRTEDFVERVRQLTGDGVDVVFAPSVARGSCGGPTARCGLVAGWCGSPWRRRPGPGSGSSPLSLLTRFVLTLVPDGRQAPLPADAAEPNAWYRVRLAGLLELLASGKLSPAVAERIPPGGCRSRAPAARARRIRRQGRPGHGA